jgi:hypothetical protein
MAEGIDPKKLDKRTAERYLRGGQVDEDAYKKHIEELPDVADKSVTISTTMEGDDLDDYDDEDEDDTDETTSEDSDDEDSDDEDSDDEDSDDEDSDDEDSDDEDKAADAGGEEDKAAE